MSLANKIRSNLGFEVDKECKLAVDTVKRRLPHLVRRMVSRAGKERDHNGNINSILRIRANPRVKVYMELVLQQEGFEVIDKKEAIKRAPGTFICHNNEARNVYIDIKNLQSTFTNKINKKMRGK